MRIAYEDLISGEPIHVKGVGLIRPIFLDDLKPRQSSSYALYSQHLSVISCDMENFISSLAPSQAELFKKSGNINIFDAMTVLKKEYRPLLASALKFFILGDVTWHSIEGVFVVRDSDGVITGKVSRENYGLVRSVILQMNYIEDNEMSEQKFANKRAKQLWELTQKKLKETGNKKNNKNMRLGNIISKLSAAGIGYTYQNIYQLTIYQLYDTFFQYGFLRAMDLSENAYATHGGDKFNFQQWLDPIAVL